MKWSKNYEHFRFYVIGWDETYVYLSTGEEHWDVPLGKFFRMYGRRHLVQGRYLTMVIKLKADGTVGIRGWPWLKKRTAEQIEALEMLINDILAAAEKAGVIEDEPESEVDPISHQDVLDVNQ
jgi:hypothetical protein